MVSHSWHIISCLKSYITVISSWFCHYYLFFPLLRVSAPSFWHWNRNPYYLLPKSKPYACPSSSQTWYTAHKLRLAPRQTSTCWHTRYYQNVIKAFFHFPFSLRHFHATRGMSCQVSQAQYNQPNQWWDMLWWYW